MDVGLGLPTTVAGAGERTVVDWARLGEECGFSTLGVLDRLVYDAYEPVVALAAAAAVTRRIRLATTVLIAPYRDSAALLAKQLATVDHLAGGRLTVGVAAGNRADDFDAAGTAFAGRGRRLDAQIARMRAIWAGEGGPGPVGPRPPRGGPTVLVGGHTQAALERAARVGAGWIAGAGSSTPVAERAARARRVWSRAGRGGAPTLVALAYYALGSRGREHAERYLGGYYGFLGAGAVQRVVAGTLTGEQRLREAVEEHADAGFDELVLMPCAAELAQVDLLAKAVL